MYILLLKTLFAFKNGQRDEFLRITRIIHNLEVLFAQIKPHDACVFVSQS